MCVLHRLAMPAPSTPRQSATQTPTILNERTRTLLNVARTAWADVRDALAEGQRSPSGRFGDSTTQAGLRRAMRAKPDWLDIRAPQQGAVALAPFDFNDAPEAVAGEVIGEDGQVLEVGAQAESSRDVAKREREAARRERDAARELRREQARDERSARRLARLGWVTGEDPQSTAQVDELWARARTLARELSTITAAARQSARTGTSEAVRDISSYTEQGLNAILRPVSGAIADSVAPLANAGAGIGIGVVIALGAGAYVLYVLSKKN